MKYAYVYVLDTLADWELGYVIAELNSGQYFKASKKPIRVKTIGATKDAIHTKGGMTIVPDTTLEAVTSSSTAVLLLPGADTWNDPKHAAVIERSRDLLNEGVTIAAICGATGALAHARVFDNRPHTSNSLEYLKMGNSPYKGEAFYRDERAVADDNLITASSAGGLLFARYILARLQVFSDDTLEAWYAYHQTGESKYFYDLMQTLPQKHPTGP